MRIPPLTRPGRSTALAATVSAVLLAAVGCSSSSSSHSDSASPAASGSATAASAPSASASASGPKIVAVGAENEYADVISQIGGPYVAVTAIMSNPNTDPHTFEADPKVAKTVSQAQLVVQNGLGYDDFMSKIEKASGRAGSKVVDVQSLLGLPDSTPNPHLWFKPGTAAAVAKAVAADLSAIDPAHASAYQANEATFDSSLNTWTAAVATLKSTYGGTGVATTEPVADYLLEAAGLDNKTPWNFQADVMNGVDPSPQDVAFQRSLFTQHKVKVFVYNQQVTDSLTTSLLKLAKQNHIPVVGVYETMPTPGYTYQSWMNAEVQALTNAFAHGTSAPVL